MLGTHTSVCRSASPVSYLNRKRALRNDMSRCVRGTAPARMQEAPLSGRLFEPGHIAAHRLRQWLRRYICCNGDCPCSGRMSEQSCPEFCLCAEVRSRCLLGARWVPAQCGPSTL